MGSRIISSELQISCALSARTNLQIMNSIDQAMANLQTNYHGQIVGLRPEVTEMARRQVAWLVGLEDPGEIVFYPSVEEAWQQALVMCTKGIHRPHIVCDEHMSRYVTCDHTVVTSTPRIAVEDVISAILPRTCAIFISLANPAVGTLQPAASIAQALGFIGQDAPSFGVDLTAAAGMVAVDLEYLNTALAVVSGMGAPNVAALACRAVLAPCNDCNPLWMPYIAGLGTAAQLARSHLHFNDTILRYKRNQLVTLLNRTVGSNRLTIRVPSPPDLPNILVLSFASQKDYDLAVAGVFSRQAQESSEFLIPYLRLGITPDLARKTLTVSVDLDFKDCSRELKESFGNSTQTS